jgi:hypothetical protein
MPVSGFARAQTCAGLSQLNGIFLARKRSPFLFAFLRAVSPWGWATEVLKNPGVRPSCTGVPDRYI